MFKRTPVTPESLRLLLQALPQCRSDCGNVQMSKSGITWALVPQHSNVQLTLHPMALGQLPGFQHLKGMKLPPVASGMQLSYFGCLKYTRVYIDIHNME